MGLKLAYALYLVFGFVFRPRHRGAGVAVWHAGKILILRNTYRRPWTLPGGGVRRGESSRSAAARELAEETGIRVRPGQLRQARVYLKTSEFYRDRYTLFDIHLDHAPAVFVDNREVDRAAFLPPDRALQHELIPPLRTYLETGRLGRLRD